MKKLALFVMSALCLASCSDESGIINGGNTNTDPTETRATQVYVQGKELTYNSSTRATKSYTCAAEVSENTVPAHFFLRIDNRIPSIEGHSIAASQYLPQQFKGSKDLSLISSANAGIVNLEYAYTTDGAQYPITRYLFDTTGKETKKVLVEEPDLYTLLHANQNTDYTSLINALNLDSCKVIWYIVKEGERNGWHVDGVLTMKSTKDVSEIPGMNIKDENKNLDNAADKPSLPEEVVSGNGNVEVDIHQQLHQDWDEVKTSIHVRDLVDEVKVEIPLEKSNVAEADDFAIRTYDYDLESKVFLNGKEYVLNDNNPIKIAVEHQADKVVITISAISHDYITALRQAYGDGVTVEVHTYPTNLSKSEIFDRVKASTVSVVPASYDSSKIIVHRTKYAETETAAE